MNKLILACALILSFPLHAAPKADKEDLKQLRGKIESLQRELANTEESKSEAADALRESEQAVSDANRKLAALAHAQGEANDRLNQLQTQAGQIKNHIEAQRSQLSKFLYRQYTGGGGGRRSEYLSLLLDQQDPNRIARNLHYYGYLSRAIKQNIDVLRINLERLDELTRESRAKRSEIAMIQAKQAEQKKQLEQEKAGHKKLLARISAQADQQRLEIEKLKRDEERLARLVEKIAKLLARKNRTAPLSNDRLPDASTDGNPFPALKGRLSLPVRGELANRFGSLRASGDITWKGLFIRSVAGEEVKAVAGGRVVFSDWLRGFGNLMIVDHGGSYMSLYGNNETNNKRVGEVVRGGDTIATVGNSGGNPHSGLYFELRHQGKPFDPLNWVRIKPKPGN
ncbi:MAG: peptidoglycan DD-metalloendopeptidase family protein [Nitrosospira sp.]|nr:peptidoglycan DD-metalloendopeptidase family protein [Nitrosospira sp.]